MFQGKGVLRLNHKPEGWGAIRSGRRPVQCAVGSSTFQYAFVGSNPYYVKLQITNTRCALAAACSARCAQLRMAYMHMSSRLTHAQSTAPCAILFRL